MVVRIDDPRVFRTDPVTGEVFQVLSYIDDEGREVPDGVPMALPVEIAQHRTLAQMVADAVRGEVLRQQAVAGGYESFDESEDYDIEDDSWDRETPYQRDFEPSREPPAAAPAAPEGQGVSAAPPPSTPSDSPVKDDGGRGAKPPKADVAST